MTESTKTNPWDIPPLPRSGDNDADQTYAAVGRAMSEWEDLELYLIRLYAKFLGIPPIKAIKLPEIRKASIFNARAQVIEKAARNYFIAHPDQCLEAEFTTLICDIRKLSQRRNDIAHGVVRVTWKPGDLASGESLGRAVDRGKYTLMPATYSAKKFGPTRTPAYLFRSIEINRYSEHFRDYRVRAELLLVNLP